MRRAVLLAATGSALLGQSPKFAVIDEMTQLRQVLGLGAAASAFRLHCPCAGFASRPALLTWLSEGIDKLHVNVGEEWHTAALTVPSLVSDDLLHGHTHEFAGLVLTRTEWALLLA